MKQDKKYYEELIRSSTLFSLDRNMEAIAYKREALKMVEYLYLYLLCINENYYIEFGLEITETANRCISNFNPDEGDFLNYFVSSVSKECKRAKTQQLVQEIRGGGHIPENINRIIRFIIKTMEKRGIKNMTPEQASELADLCGISEKLFREIIFINQFSTVASNYSINDDGEEIDIFDIIPDEDQVDSILIAEDNIFDILLRANQVYLESAPQTRRVISKDITSHCALIIVHNPNLIDRVKRLDFFDEEVYNTCVKRGYPLTQKEIAESIDRTAQSVSRTLNKAFPSRANTNIK